MLRVSQRRLELGLTYYSQLDNDSDWNSGSWNECSFSAMAVALSGCGLVGNGDGQFDDQIERAFEAQGLTRGAPYDMSDFMASEYQEYGVVATYRPNATLDDVLDAIEKGRAVILHTDLTASGHVIAVNGFDLDAYRGKGALLVHDPNGEWFESGYRQDLSGENVPIMFSTCDRLMGPDGNYWMHQVWKK